MKYVRAQPELKVRNAIRKMFEGRGWGVWITHGNKYQSGFPDLYVAHPEYGERWIDAKVEGHYSYTKAQKYLWPLWHYRYKVGTWIMTGDGQEQYDRVFRAPNWRDYWRPVWGDPEANLTLKTRVDDTLPLDAQPELKIRTAIRIMLESLGWGVWITHGNTYQSGFPDLYVAHPKHGTRWIDAKVEGRYSFTKAQKRLWPLWHYTYKIGLWIITGDDRDQYARLNERPNWLDYWRSAWGDPRNYLKEPDIDGILDQITD
jgi:hypothetical protein